MHVKKGDKVVVITGKYKGKSSTVHSTIPSSNRVVLEDVGTVKRHTRPRKQGEKGGIVDKKTSIHASNVKKA